MEPVSVKGAIVFGPVRALCEPQIGDEQVAGEGPVDACLRARAGTRRRPFVAAAVRRQQSERCPRGCCACACSISWLTVQRVADSACTSMQCACAEWNQGRSLYWRDLSGLRVRPVRPGQDARRGDVRGAVPAPGAKWTITNSCDGSLTHDIAHLIASLTSSAIRRSSCTPTRATSPRPAGRRPRLSCHEV
jgi:hypothetical protein